MVPIEKEFRPTVLSLKATIGLPYMIRLNGLAAFLGWIEQAPLALPLQMVRLSFPAAATAAAAKLTLVQILGVLDLQSLLGQGLDHLKSQEAQDVDNVVIGLTVRNHSEPGPFPEALSLAEGEGSLTTFRPVDVLFLGHILGAFVGFFEALEAGVVHFLFVLVFFILALGYALTVEAGHVPWKSNLGLLVLLRVVRGLTVPAQHIRGAGVFARDKIGIGAAFVVRCFDVLAHVLPGEEGHQSRHLGLVVTDQEDKIVCTDRSRSSTSS